MKFSKVSLALALAVTLAAGAQPAPVVPPAAAEKAEEPKPLPSRVIWVKGPRHPAPDVRLGEEIRIGVQGYGELQKAAASHPKPITLWLSGNDSKLAPVAIEPLAPGEAPATKPPMTGEQREDARVLTYRLTRTGDNAALWRDLLRDPLRTRNVSVSVGVSGDKPLLLHERVTGQPLRLEKFFFTIEGAIAAVVFLLVVVLLFRFKSDMLRNGPEIDGKKQAYSLGRSQMAFWFILILGSYIGIWLVTGDRDTITTSSLVLMGISAVTAMGAIAIDSGAAGRANDVRRELETEKAELERSLAIAKQAATPQGKTLADALELRVVEIDQTVANVVKPPITTGRWLRDVLTDNSGVMALHRFQIVFWTAILGVIFVASVGRDLSMPEFNATLLALMGISAGTYLGFKVPTNAG